MNKQNIPIKIVKMLLLLLVCYGCSSNENLARLNEEKIESFKLIVPPIFCNEDILTKEKIKEKDFNDYQILYYSDSRNDISDLIKSLKNELPKLADVFGSSYGEPTIRLKVNIDRKEKNIGIISTDGIEYVLKENLSEFNYIVLNKYELYEKEKFNELIDNLDKLDIEYFIWRYNYDDRRNVRIDKYPLIIESYSKKSYFESRQIIKNFINNNKYDIASYSIGKIYSTYKTDNGEIKKGYPTSARLYIKEKSRFLSLFSLAKESGLIKKERTVTITPIEIYIDNSKIEKEKILEFNLSMN